MPEKLIKEQKIKIHIDIFKKLHEKLTFGGEGNILNQIKVQQNIVTGINFENEKLEKFK